MNLLFSSDSWAFGFQHYVKGTATYFPATYLMVSFYFWFLVDKRIIVVLNSKQHWSKKVLGQLDTKKRPILK